MMIRKIGAWLVLICMLLTGTALAETATTTAVTATTAAALIPETVDVGVLNELDIMKLWPWRSLTIRTRGGVSTAYVDILVEVSTMEVTMSARKRIKP